MNFFTDQVASNPGLASTIGQAVTGAKKKVKGALQDTMVGNAFGVKPPEVQDPAPVPMMGAPTQAASKDPYAEFFPKVPMALSAPPENNGLVGPTVLPQQTGFQPQFAGMSQRGQNPSGPPAPLPGQARAWSSQGPSTPQTPVQNFSVPTGPQPVHPENRPAPIGRTHLAGEGDTGGGGGGGTTAAHNIASFYDSIGMPLDQVIGGAQRDEELAKHAWAQREGSEATTRGLQQQGMIQGLQGGPQNELVKRISELSTANLYNPTPEGTMLIKHYMQQLQGMSGPQAGSGQQQEASTPAATPTQPPVTNNHPGVGGMLHAAIHRGLPAAAGAGGWAAGAALAPETGGLSLAIPAAASLASYWGGNKLMDAIDPGGAEAATEHPKSALTGQAVGGFAGYGIGRGMRPAGKPEGSLSTKNVGANTGGPAGTIGAEETNPGMPVPTARQMSPFGGGEVHPGQTPVAPPNKQLGMGSLGAQAAASQNTQTAGTPSPMPSQATPFAPPSQIQMSGDPQVEAALAEFKKTIAGQPSNIIPMPQQQQTPTRAGMQSTALPTPRVGAMRVEQPAERQRVGTNPVQMPQQPSGVTTLNPALMDPAMLQRLIGDPRIGPAITHDPAFQALIQRYINSPAQ